MSDKTVGLLGISRKSTFLPTLLVVLFGLILSAPAMAGEFGDTITYSDNGMQKIYAFTQKDDGHLYVNYWDGSKWNWADQGMPPGSTVSNDLHGVSAITYSEAGSQRIYVFVQGNDGLYVNYWDGNQWNWADQGSSSDIGGIQPSAITYQEGGVQKIYVFVAGGDGHLNVNYWDGNQWQWADQGAPSGIGLLYPEAITYNDAGTQRIYAFVQGVDGHLYVNYWDGNQWQWADQGTPSGTTVDESIKAVTYNEAGTQKIYAFVKGKDGHAYVNYWDGSQWQWADQGMPPGTVVARLSDSITYNEAGTQRIYTFVQGNNGHLYVNYWNGDVWQWADQGQPSSARTVARLGGAITYNEAGTQRIYAFSWSNGNSFYVNYWDGNQWQWADQGVP